MFAGWWSLSECRLLTSLCWTLMIPTPLTQPMLQNMTDKQFQNCPTATPPISLITHHSSNTTTTLMNSCIWLQSPIHPFSITPLSLIWHLSRPFHHLAPSILYMKPYHKHSTSPHHFNLPVTMFLPDSAPTQTVHLRVYHWLSPYSLPLTTALSNYHYTPALSLWPSHISSPVPNLTLIFLFSCTSSSPRPSTNP